METMFENKSRGKTQKLDGAVYQLLFAHKKPPFEAEKHPSPGEKKMIDRLRVKEVSQRAPK